MNDSGAFGEQPVVRSILQHVDIVRSIVIVTEATPSFGDQRSHASLFHCLEDHLCELIWVIYDDGSKSDINWRLSSI
jgi:hypothetical protein